MGVDNLDLMDRLDELIEHNKRIADSLEVIAACLSIKTALDKSQQPLWIDTFKLVFNKIEKMTKGKN